MKIHDIVNILHIKPYKEWLPGYPVIWSSLVDITKDYKEVHKINYLVDFHLKEHCFEYLVYWKGFE